MNTLRNFAKSVFARISRNLNISQKIKSSVLSRPQNICIPMSLFIYKPYVLGTESRELEHKRFRVHIAKRVFYKLETFKVKPITCQKPQMFGMYPQIDLSTKTIESINCL